MAGVGAQQQCSVFGNIIYQKILSYAVQTGAHCTLCAGVLVLKLMLYSSEGDPALLGVRVCLWANTHSVGGLGWQQLMPSANIFLCPLYQAY